MLAHEVVLPREAKRWVDWVVTTDHKRIGIMYLVPRVRSVEPMRDIRREVERQTGVNQRTGGSERFARG